MKNETTGPIENPIAALIETAETVSNPLDRIVERTAIDRGTPFTPDILASLIRLRLEDRPAFETLRGQLKQAGCRVVELDKAIAQHSGNTHEAEAVHQDKLLELAQNAEFFRAPDGTGYADIDVNGHRETWQISSKSFSRWLRRAYFEATQRAPGGEAFAAAINLVEASAQFGSTEHAVCVRVAESQGRIYIDLCDESWSAVEIDASGWRVVSDPPVRFRRARGTRPMPTPVPGGSIEILRSLLNIQAESHFVLVVSWLMACLRPGGPYPVLAISGEQGSAKSSFAKVLKLILDPNSVPYRSLARDERDLSIAANNAHVLTYDNISGLQPWISDALCRLSTGGGFAVRKLCTDQDEVLFEGARPILLNGIDDFITRPDLADRAISLVLQPIPENQRRPETELWARFQTELPRLLGALLDGVVEGIKRLPETRLENLPRMADFALWATACERAYWPAGTFMAAYAENRDGAVEGIIDADPIAAAVRALMVSREAWKGTATGLLSELAATAGERVACAKTWPDNPRAMSSRLRRAATVLRKIGLDIDFDREGRGRTRIITITATRTTGPLGHGTASSASSASSATAHKGGPEGLLPRAPTARTADAVADDPWVDLALSVRASQQYCRAADDADAADDDFAITDGDPDNDVGRRVD